MHPDCEMQIPNIVYCHRCRTQMLQVATNMVTHYPGIVICPTCGMAIRYARDDSAEVRDMQFNSDQAAYQSNLLYRHYKQYGADASYRILGVSDAVKEQIDYVAYKVLEVVDKVLAPFESGLIRVGGLPIKVSYSLLMLNIVYGSDVTFDLTLSSHLENDPREKLYFNSMQFTVPLNWDCNDAKMQSDVLTAQLKEDIIPKIVSQIITNTMYRLEIGTFPD